MKKKVTTFWISLTELTKNWEKLFVTLIFTFVLNTILNASNNNLCFFCFNEKQISLLFLTKNDPEKKYYLLFF